MCTGHPQNCSHEQSLASARQFLFPQQNCRHGRSLVIAPALQPKPRFWDNDLIWEEKERKEKKKTTIASWRTGVRESPPLSLIRYNSRHDDQLHKMYVFVCTCIDYYIMARKKQINKQTNETRRTSYMYSSVLKTNEPPPPPLPQDIITAHEKKKKTCTENISPLRV